MRFARLITVLLIAQISFLSGQAQAMPEVIPGLMPVQRFPCPFTLPDTEKEGDSYWCGMVSVPLDYTRPAGPRLDLAIALLAATDPSATGDPVLWLEGGPGASALVVADTNRQITAETRVSHDILLIDQRGSGYSGYLDCGAYQAAAAIRAAESGTPLPEAPGPSDAPDLVYAYASRTAASGYDDCRQGYAEAGIDLAWFRTETIAHDALTVLDALGFSRAILWGTSYGGRVAMEIMRTAPERVQAAVLDSPLPTGVRRLATFSNLTMEPVAQLLAACTADPACAAAFPDLESRTMALVESLNRQPLPLPPGEAGSAGLSGGFDGAALVRLLTTLLPANPRMAPMLPRAIADLEQGDPARALDLMTGNIALSEPPLIPPTLTETTFDTLNDATDARLALSLAMRTVVLCNDEAAAVTLADLVQNDTGVQFPVLRTETAFRSSVTLLAQCDALGFDTPPLVTDPPTEPIPVLVLSGAYDATTAPSWAEQAASLMPAAHWLLIPDAGHAVTRWSACAREIVASFVASPGEPDTGCLTQEQHPFLV